MMGLTSPAFGQYGPIPARFATPVIPGGQGVSIPYTWEGVPTGTVSLALALVDRAPVAHDWLHWLVTDMPSTTMELSEGASRTSAMPAGAVEHPNTFGVLGYGGPQPPMGTGEHAYEATLYALDVDRITLPDGASYADFLRALDGHVLAQASHSGRFAHP